MAKRKLSVRKIKEVLRLHYEKGLSTREIANSWASAEARFKITCIDLSRRD